MRSHKIFSLTVLVCLSSAVTYADIVGGEEVAQSDPIQNSTVAVYNRNPSGQGGSLCTASLIDKDIALTAAHCVPRGGKPALLFGRDIHSSNTVMRPVTGVSVNPKWEHGGGKGMDQGDLAVVKFGGGLPLGYEKIETLSSDKELKNGRTAVLAGYGISNAHTHAGAGVLRKTEIKIASSRPGKTEMILDQTRGRGACHGDSGGPAFIRSGGRTILAGVTNRGYPFNAPDDCAHKVVYTKVSAYKPWIEKEKKALRKQKSEYKLHAKLQNARTHHTHHVVAKKIPHSYSKTKNRLAKLTHRH